jgi:hypothetical protein
MGWTVLPCPPFTPDLATSDFHIFGPLKDALRGRRFADDDELKHSVRDDLRRFSKELYTTGIQRLTQRYKKCVDNEGDFVKYAPMIYVSFTIIVILVSKKKVGGITVVPALVYLWTHI